MVDHLCIHFDFTHLFKVTKSIKKDTHQNFISDLDTPLNASRYLGAEEFQRLWSKSVTGLMHALGFPPTEAIRKTVDQWVLQLEKCSRS